jgi:hypothetical protein
MAGILKVDTLQNSSAENMITQTNSTTLTIGTSGDTVTLAAGATSSGFGATYNGAVNWDTTPKTTTVTAVSGVGYFVNTTSGAITVNLPAGSAGAVVALADYAGTWGTNAVTVNANGTEKIGGAASSPATLNTQGQSVTFIYVDSTRGWTNVGDATYVTGATYVTATGGTITTCGDYKIHSFTGPGTFTVTSTANNPTNNAVDYLVVAGGGGSAGYWGAAGGAGGYRESKATGAPWTASPLATSTSLPVSATAYPVTVGAGGTGSTGCNQPPNRGGSGGNSVFSTITSAGGGGGGGGYLPVCSGGNPGNPGGSGGGAGGYRCHSGGAGNTPPVSPPQGNPGGNNPGGQTQGGGGGATAAGGNGTGSGTGGQGGAGAGTGINPSPTVGTPGPTPGLRYFAGGGSGQQQPAGGVGGGGRGNPCGTGGVTNTGGGAGNEQYNGGSGIVVIRYKFQ